MPRFHAIIGVQLMRPPCEIATRSLLPVLRALVAQELMSTHGWMQNQIATRLGVTQPAVSGYLALLDKGIIRKFDVEDLRGVAKSIAAGFASGELTSSEAVSRVCEWCVKSKCLGIVCALHKQNVPELSKEACEICLRLYSRGIKPVDDRYEVLMDIRRAVSVLEESEEFPKVMPEVRVNIVAAIPDAKTISDVAGIPGRIAKVRGRIKAFMEPEFGVSVHMATVLLTVMKNDKKIKAATNVKYDVFVEEAAKKLGFSVSEFDRAELPKEAPEGIPQITRSVEKAIKKIGIVPDVIIDRGRYGIEPMAYIFGTSAVNAVKKAVQIAEKRTQILQETNK